MSDTVTSYLEERASATKAAEKLNDYIKAMESVVGALRNHRDTFHFTNLANGHGILEGRVKMQKTQDARLFPTAEKIQDALNDYWRASDATWAAWKAMPESQRGGVQPPPA
jgi:hypothetical protein